MPFGIWDRTVSVSPRISADVVESSAKKREMESSSLASKRWTRPSPAKRFGMTVTRREAPGFGGRQPDGAGFCDRAFLITRLLTVSSGDFYDILPQFRIEGRLPKTFFMVL